MFIGIYDPLGAKTDRLRCEVCQNLILSPMNTGLLRPAVATAPTVHGIETKENMLIAGYAVVVATAPTVHGIETDSAIDVDTASLSCNSTYRSRY